MIKAVFKCMGYYTLPMSIATVLAGTACAALTGNSMPLPACICALFAILAQISANLYHRYCDEKYHYGENIDDGFPNMDSEGLTLLRVLREGTIAFAVMAMMAGLAIMTTAPVYSFVIGILVVLGVYFYSSGPAPLCRLPLGIIIPFLFFGPIGVIGTNFVQVARDFHAGDSLMWVLTPAIWVGIIMGLFAINCQIWDGYGVRSKSVSNASRSFVVIVGARGARICFLISSILILAISVFTTFNFHLRYPWWAMSAPLVCTAINFVFYWLMHSRKEEELGKYSFYVNLNMLLYAVIILIEFTFDGIPDESIFHYF